MLGAVGRTLADVGEFGVIERLRRRAYAGRRPPAGVVLGIGDDAAVLRTRAREDVVATTDALVEDVHFRWAEDPPAALGRRALVANLSDLAAMGARPLGFTLALQAPPDLPLARLDALARGLGAAAREHACPWVGGNVARARETSLVIQALGAVRRGRALRRGPVRARDRLLVTGVLGRMALARARAGVGGAPVRRIPEPRLGAGRALAASRWRVACVDLSDGLAADLPHLLEGSGCGADVDPAALPRPHGFGRACARLGRDPLELLAGGGEDYELLFALAPSAAPASEVGRRLGVPVSEIGRVSSRPGIRGLPRAGWRHF